MDSVVDVDYNPPAELARERGRRDQPVVPRTDHDDVALADHRALHHHCSARIRLAALRPGAPMIPPPGWVADPHM